MRVLVTGGAGYIGSHTAYALLDRGHEVVILDNLSTGVEENVPKAASFVLGNVGDPSIVSRTLAAHHIDAVIHFAGSISVPESVSNPLKYYDNNTAATRSLIEQCLAADVHTFIFSSTAAVYGMPPVAAVTETITPDPINPYGDSKWMIERILKDTAAATELRFVALRYFNVAGADPQGRTGQSTPQATHLIKVAAQAALGRRDGMDLFGTDYDTPDGTCVRDYIHVSDLADVHILALDYLKDGGASTIMNCGYGNGYSVREVIDVVKKVSASEFEVREVGRRAGDPPTLISDPSLVHKTLPWTPQYNDLEQIVSDALRWEKTL